MDGVMAQKEIQKKDKSESDSDTKEVMVKEEIIRRDKPQSESYLKTIARRSKAGFERVHTELLRKYKESTDMADKWSERRLSFRTSKKPRHKKNTEAAVHFRCGTFKSYVCSTDEDNGPLATIKDTEETDLKSTVSQTQTLPCKTRLCNDEIGENHPIVSKETEPIKGGIDGKNSTGSAYLPNSNSRKLADGLQKTNADTGNKANVQDPIYDIPPTTSEDNNDDDAGDTLYIPMDRGINGRTSPDKETGDYINVLSKGKEPPKKANGSKCTIESANLPNGNPRKLEDRLKKTNDPIYDIPPTISEAKNDKDAGDTLYIPMDCGINGRTSPDEEIDDYINVLSKGKEPLKKANGSKCSIETANLPNGNPRKLVDRLKKRNAGIERKTDVEAQIYDIPPQPCGYKSSLDKQEKDVDDGLYVPMDIGATDEEADDYTNIDETLKFKKSDTSSGIYVNCPNKTCKQSYNKKDTVDIYCSTEMFSENVTYTTVNKVNKMKGTGKIERETLLDDPNDYINCDEIDTTLPQCLLQQNDNSVATADDKDGIVVKTSKEGFKRQTTVPSNVKYEDTVYINEKSFVAMPPPPEPEFYSYSIEEVEEALKSCALPHIAKVCKEERLDGSFFRDINKEVLKEEPFRMNCFYIGKFFRVVNGWRPRRMTLNM